VHGGAAGCVSLDAVADPAPRYLEFSGLSGGLDASICEDWSVTLARIGEEIFGLETGFPLSRDPDIARGLEVRIDGVVLPGDRWRYDPAARSVIIEPPPPDGARVEVEYLAAC
jgi:hypothetical protein